jgi:hypothetical protein
VKEGKEDGAGKREEEDEEAEEQVGIDSALMPVTDDIEASLFLLGDIFELIDSWRRLASSGTFFGALGGSTRPAPRQEQVDCFPEPMSKRGILL